MFFRDVASVVMDLNDTEVIRFAAVGGADTIVVNDLDGTDVRQVAIDLAATSGGATGDARGRHADVQCDRCRERHQP